MAIDLTDPVAVAWLKVYIAQCDVLVENLRPGVMEDLGLDAARLRATVLAGGFIPRPATALL